MARNFYSDFDWIASRTNPTRVNNTHQASVMYQPEINWEDDTCTNVVRSTCSEIGVSVAITAGAAFVTWVLTTTRGGAIGLFKDGPAARNSAMRGNLL